MTNLTNNRIKYFIFSLMITTILFVVVPTKPAQAVVHGTIGKAVTTITNKINDIKNEIVGEINNLSTQVKNIATKVADVTVQVGKKLYDFLKDMVRLIVGLNPASLIDTLVYNESLCTNLPVVLKNPDEYIGPQLKALEEKIPFLPLIQDKIGFSITDITLPDQVRGIDPKTATSRELYEYNLYTVKPLSAISDMSLGPFKIPAVIGSSFAGFCADATEFYLGEKGGDDVLVADIHHDLSAGKDHKNAQYQLPNSAGGYLEDVASVVSSTILKYEGLTMFIEGEVYVQLQKGQTYMANGQYRKAYKAFQKSYQKLTKS